MLEVLSNLELGFDVVSVCVPFFPSQVCVQVVPQTEAGDTRRSETWPAILGEGDERGRQEGTAMATAFTSSEEEEQEVANAMALSEPVPESMSFFSTDETDEGSLDDPTWTVRAQRPRARGEEIIRALAEADHPSRPRGRGKDTTTAIAEDHTTSGSRTAAEDNPDEDPFAVKAGRFVYGCGAFFALKIQSAKTAHQLDEFAKEAENLEKLRGHSNIVQIRDHTIMRTSLHVVILMELAACDLHTFFSRMNYAFDVAGMLSIFRSLVEAVDAAHKQEIIHRDLKPQNFLLVPIAPPCADRILATTTVPPEKFEFRIVNRARTSVHLAEGDSDQAGDEDLQAHSR